MNGWMVLAAVALVLSVRAFYRLMMPIRKPLNPDWVYGGASVTRFGDGTYRVQGIENGIKTDTGWVPYDVNYWELDEQRPTGGGDSQRP